MCGGREVTHDRAGPIELDFALGDAYTIGLGLNISTPKQVSITIFLHPFFATS